MIYLANLLAAAFFTFFLFEIFPEIPPSALMTFALFLGWYIVFWLFSFFYSRTHFRKVPAILSFTAYYVKEVVLASCRVAYDVVTPTHNMKAGLVIFPLEAKTPLEISLLANFITLTPGSLVLDISPDQSLLYIHETYLRDGDIQKYKAFLKNGLEKKLLKIIR